MTELPAVARELVALREATLWVEQVESTGLLHHIAGGVGCCVVDLRCA
jgi:hypothetical protein